jgi:hypothetical protein
MLPNATNEIVDLTSSLAWQGGESYSTKAALKHTAHRLPSNIQHTCCPHTYSTQAVLKHIQHTG